MVAHINEVEELSRKRHINLAPPDVQAGEWAGAQQANSGAALIFEISIWYLWRGFFFYAFLPFLLFLIFTFVPRAEKNLDWARVNEVKQGVNHAECF